MRSNTQKLLKCDVNYQSLSKEKTSKTGAPADGTTYLMWFNLLAILGKVVRGRQNHQLIQWLSTMPMWCTSQVFTAWAYVRSTAVLSVA